jgi:hypothetical protein
MGSSKFPPGGIPPSSASAKEEGRIVRYFCTVCGETYSLEDLRRRPPLQGSAGAQLTPRIAGGYRPGTLGSMAIRHIAPPAAPALRNLNWWPVSD